MKLTKQQFIFFLVLSVVGILTTSYLNSVGITKILPWRRLTLSQSVNEPHCQELVESSFLQNLPKHSKAESWEKLKTFIRCEFPTVRHITTQELAEIMQTGSPEIQLLDTREEAEFLVSHIPGAQHIPDLKAARQANLKTDILTVAYCSVGYRSSKLAEELEVTGFQRVVNLEGSLFQWANEGRPLVRQETLTQQVHPFDETWGWFLNSDIATEYNHEGS